MAKHDKASIWALRFLRTLLLLSFLLHQTFGQTTYSLGTCPQDRCLCNVNVTGVLSPSEASDSDEWRRVFLATATGFLTSTMVLSSVAAWWKWSTAASPNNEIGSQRPRMSDRRELTSVSSSSSGSWATPRDDSGYSARSPRDINLRTDSPGSDTRSFRGGGGRVWPQQFE